MLGHSERPLWDDHDLAMLDLDGVVYVGADAVPGAADHLAAAREHQRLAFITNNASRPPAEVARHLRELGMHAEPDDVVTSAQAAARVLADSLEPGSRVAVLGAVGLREAVTEAGLVPVDVSEVGGGRDGVDESVVALVTGYGPDVRWGEVMRAAVAIKDGLRWVASNTDMSIPTPFGSAPGHGVQVDLLRRFTQVEPVVAGKPARPHLDETVRRVGGRHPLMVGDRLDTDIAGGRAAGIETLLVLTGVTGLAELVAARAGERPTYLSGDLGGLGVRHPRPRQEGSSWLVGDWRAHVDGDELRIVGAGDRDDWWRAVACAAWDHLDATDRSVSLDGVVAPVGSGA